MAQVFNSGHLTPESPQRYIRLFFDDLNLLLPQHQLHTLEPVSDLQTPAVSQDGVGWMANGGHRWPVYCLSGALETMHLIPDNRRICVLVAHQSRAFGLVCENVDTMPEQELMSWPLPNCMYTPGTPINALALHDRRVYCMSTVTSMGIYMEHRGWVTVANSERAYLPQINL